MNRNFFIENLKNGEEQALTALVNQNQDKVFRTCLAYVHNKEDAYDLTQETFLKALEKLNQYKGDSQISTWIIRIAINLSLNFIRDNKKRLQQMEISDLQIETNDQENFLKKESKKEIRNAILQLPDKQRKVFILNYYLDMNYKEINEITSYTVSSIESLLFRARRKLRILLKDFYTEKYK